MLPSSSRGGTRFARAIFGSGATPELLGGAAWWQNDWSRLGRAVLAALAASAFLWVLVLVLPTGMGQGDARLSMLLGLFLGWQSWRAVYAHALAHGYRFLSYGDSSLLLPPIT